MLRASLPSSLSLHGVPYQPPAGCPCTLPTPLEPDGKTPSQVHVKDKKKMPKSKRKRKTALTKTEGKGAQLKMDLVEKIRDSVDNYKFLYVFSYENMRTNMFKQVRKELKDSRLFLGKNKVMQIALGRTEAEEYGDELMEISKQLSGNKGLLFSDKNVKQCKIFNSSTQKDFARAGNLATETVEFEEGLCHRCRITWTSHCGNSACQSC